MGHEGEILCPPLRNGAREGDIVSPFKVFMMMSMSSGHWYQGEVTQVALCYVVYSYVLQVSHVHVWMFDMELRIEVMVCKAS